MPAVYDIPAMGWQRTTICVIVPKYEHGLKTIACFVGNTPHTCRSVDIVLCISHSLPGGYCRRLPFCRLRSNSTQITSRPETSLLQTLTCTDNRNARSKTNMVDTGCNDTCERFKCWPAQTIAMQGRRQTWWMMVVRIHANPKPIVFLQYWVHTALLEI